MTKKKDLFVWGMMVLFLSAPLYMDYVPASEHLAVYYMETPGIRGLFPQIPGWLLRIGFSMSASAKLTILLMNILACTTSWFCFQKLSPQQDNAAVGAMAGSICYVFSIYSVYIRYYAASIGEMAAYGILPVILYGFIMIYKEDTKKARLGGLGCLLTGLTLLFYAHIPMALIVWAMVFLGCLLMGKESFSGGRLIPVAGAQVGALLLGLPILWPYVQEIQKGTFYINDGLLFSDRGLEIAELFRTVTGRVTNEDPGTFSMAVGLPLILVIPTLCFLLNAVKEHGVCISTKRKKGIFAGMLLAGLCMLLSLRIFPWALLENLHGAVRTGLQHIGYPHRFLMVAVLLLCAGVVLLYEKGTGLLIGKYPEYQVLIRGVGLSVIIAINLFTGIYFMNNLVYTTPLDGTFQIRDSLWVESEFLLYISK